MIDPENTDEDGISLKDEWEDDHIIVHDVTEEDVDSLLSLQQNPNYHGGPIQVCAMHVVH